MSMKCTKCKAEYSEGVICQKCGQVLVENEQADQLAPLLVQADDYEQKIADGSAAITTTDDVVDYWSKTPELIDEKKAEEEAAEQQVTEILASTASSHDQDLVAENNITDNQAKLASEQLADDTTRLNNGDKEIAATNRKLIIGAVVAVVVVILIVLFLLKGVLFKKDDASQDEQVISTTVSQTETTIDKQVLKDDLSQRLNGKIATIEEAIFNVHTEKKVPVSLAVTNGQLYSISLQKYITMSQLGIKDSGVVELYAAEDGLIIGDQLDDEYGYIVFTEESANNDLQVAPSKQSFLENIQYKAVSTAGVRLLQNGDSDRQLIYEQILAMSSEFDDIVFRYLAGDGNNAFAIWSPLNDYQTINYDYLQVNEEGDWQSKFGYHNDIDVYSVISDVSSLDDYNLSVLPPIDPADFTVKRYEQADIDQIVAYLKARGLVDASANLLFMSNIDDNAYLSFSDGVRLLILFKENSKTVFDEIITMDPNQPNQAYFDQLNSVTGYDAYYPLHIFIQD